MEEKKQEVVELQLKPNNYSSLEVTNKVKTWLYNALNDPRFEWYRVYERGNTLGLEFRYKDGRKYADDEKITLWLDARLVWDPTVEFSERWVDIEWHPERKEVAGESSRVYWRDFKPYDLINMDGIIQLNNWKFLINKYGKYQPNLSFLASIPSIEYEKVSSRDLNFGRWDFSVIYWEYFTSKKWTKCFRILPKDKAKHVLIRDGWWWPFNKYRWRTLPEESALYYRRACSNGWGAWCDYGVYDINFRNTISEDDI